MADYLISTWLTLNRKLIASSKRFELSTKFQRLHPHFPLRPIHRCHWRHRPTTPTMLFQLGGLWTGSRLHLRNWMSYRRNSDRRNSNVHDIMSPAFSMTFSGRQMCGCNLWNFAHIYSVPKIQYTSGWSSSTMSYGSPKMYGDTRNVAVQSATVDGFWTQWGPVCRNLL